MKSESITDIIKDVTIDDAITVINRLEDNQGLSVSTSMVKWKSYQRQVVIESDEFFYKIYEFTEQDTTLFDHIVREALSNIFNEMGIRWDLITIRRDGKVFDFEQREKLQVASEQDGDFGSLLLSISYLYDRVEKFLEFDSILSQLHEIQQFSCVKKLKLSRLCVNKYKDYAIFEGQTVLLDDADFYIALIGHDDEIVDVLLKEEVVVSTSYGNYLFSSLASDGGVGLDSEFEEDSKKGFCAWVLRKKEEEISSLGQSAVNVRNDTEIIRESGGERGCSPFLIQDNDLRLVDYVEASFVGADLQAFPQKIIRNNETKINQRSLVIQSSLIDPIESETYKKLDSFNPSDKDVWLATTLNPTGDILKGREFKTWMTHMQTIFTLYPNINIIIFIFLSRQFCEYFLCGKFNPYDFLGKYSSPKTYSFISPKNRDNFPDRDLFREFLLKFAKQYPKCYRLFFSDYYSSNSVKNENPTFSPFIDAFGLESQTKGSKEDVGNATCLKHATNYYCRYADCSECMLCDFEQIKNSLL